LEVRMFPEGSITTLLQFFSILFPVAGMLLIVAGALLLLASAYEKGEGRE